MAAILLREEVVGTEPESVVVAVVEVARPLERVSVNKVLGRTPIVGDLVQEPVVPRAGLIVPTGTGAEKCYFRKAARTEQKLAVQCWFCFLSTLGRWQRGFLVVQRQNLIHYVLCLFRPRYKRAGMHNSCTSNYINYDVSTS